MVITPEEFQALQRELRTVREVEAIKRVKYAYCRCIDTADLEELRTLLHEEIVMRFVGGRHENVVRGRDEYLRLIAGLVTEQMIAQHTVHHPEIDLSGETEATGTWYLHGHFYRLWDMHHVTGAALYHDRYVKTEGRWQIIESRYASLYEIDYVMEHVPPITAHFLAGRGRPSPG